MRRLTGALIALEVLATGFDLVAGPHSALHWEERVNARNGALFACGHLNDWAVLQYRTFCGGCTAQGLLAAPVFLALGVTVGAWKFVVASVHLAVVAAGALLARRIAGWGPAALYVLVLMASPGFYREQALTGWGNHAESSLFPLLAALMVGRGLAGATGAGLTLGLGTWFAPITAHAVPALAWLSRRPRWGPVALGAGLGVGLLPIAAFLQARPAGGSETGTLWSSFSIASPEALWGLLSTTGIGEGLWSPFEYGEVGQAALAWWAALWALGLTGAVIQSRSRRPLRGLLALCLGGLVAAYAVRYDLWRQLPEFPDHPTFNLRYLAPLVPWLALGTAIVPSGAGRARRPVLALVGLLILTGLGLRLSSWSDWRPDVLGDPIVARAERLDRTMPLGNPPQPNRREQGRPQDLEAGLTWLQDHADPLETCREVHLAELGRRLGRAQDPYPWIARAIAAANTEKGLDMLADGAAKALGGLTDLETRIGGFGALAHEVGTAWGRIHAPAWRGRTTEELLEELPPAVVEGICSARLDHLQLGRRSLRPGWHQDDPGDLDGCRADQERSFPDRSLPIF